MSFVPGTYHIFTKSGHAVIPLSLAMPHANPPPGSEGPTISTKDKPPLEWEFIPTSQTTFYIQLKNPLVTTTEWNGIVWSMFLHGEDRRIEWRVDSIDAQNDTYIISKTNDNNVWTMSGNEVELKPRGAYDEQQFVLKKL